MSLAILLIDLEVKQINTNVEKKKNKSLKLT